jgi:hypothetical protein
VEPREQQQHQQLEFKFATASVPANVRDSAWCCFKMTLPTHCSNGDLLHTVSVRTPMKRHLQPCHKLQQYASARLAR